MVRRRTCPGVDGRKQRFSRFSARKLSKFDEDTRASNSTDDETSMEDSSGDEDEVSPPFPPSATISRKKRTSESETSAPAPVVSAKKPRRIWDADKDLVPQTSELKLIDTSILTNPVSSPKSVFEAHESLVRDVDGDDDSSTNKKNERMEMVEQSMIVSEVASKLEEYARKAMKGRGTSRTRRGGFGVVTPPWGATQNVNFSARGLITYDDEYEDEAVDVVTDGDDSTFCEEVSLPGFVGAKPADTILVPPFFPSNL